jgi:NTP pyrophosphatase (non-canonical NTP hydrolase)
MNPGDTLQNLITRLKKFRDDRDWRKFHTPKDLAISVSIEAGELLEVFQWKPADDALDDEMKGKLTDEAADVLLYLLMLCDIAEVDLVAAAASKISMNETRFPVDRAFGIAKPPSAG